MPSERKIKIFYKKFGDNIGVQIYKNTPVRGSTLIHENKENCIIPSHMAIHLNYSKVEIIEYID